jgi:hypothetical protein
VKFALISLLALAAVSATAQTPFAVLYRTDATIIVYDSVDGHLDVIATAHLRNLDILGRPASEGRDTRGVYWTPTGIGHLSTLKNDPFGVYTEVAIAYITDDPTGDPFHIVLTTEQYASTSGFTNAVIVGDDEFVNLVLLAIDRVPIVVIPARIGAGRTEPEDIERSPVKLTADDIAALDAWSAISRPIVRDIHNGKFPTLTRYAEVYETLGCR